MDKKQEITEYMSLTFQLMQWAQRDPSNRSILIVTYDEERNVTGAVPVGDLKNLGIAIAYEMEKNKELCSVIKSAVYAYDKFNEMK